MDSYPGQSEFIFADPCGLFIVLGSKCSILTALLDNKQHTFAIEWSSTYCEKRFYYMSALLNMLISMIVCVYCCYDLF